MDLMEFDTPKTTLQPLPDSDYKEGKLRPVRGRVLKKLLKYEWKAMLPTLTISGIVLLALTLLTCIFVRVDLGAFGGEEYPATIAVGVILTILLYAYALIGVIVAPFIVACRRYEKNFFKDEGYLTFSIPASMEEHILAKHLSGMIAVLLAMAASLVSVVLLATFSVTGDLNLGYIELDPIVPQHPVSVILGAIEEIILFAEGLVGAFAVSGALICWGQKFKKKSQMFWRVFIAYFVFVALQTVFTMIGETGLTDFFYNTVAGEHVSTWLTIFLYAGVIAFCVWYELRTLKKKLNLK